MSDDRAYRVWVGFDPEKERFWAKVPELGAEGEGATRAEAIAAVETQIESAVEKAAVSGGKAPTPSDAAPVGGSLTITLGPSIQRDLAYQARLSNLSPEALAAQLVARALGEAPARAQAPRPTTSRPPEQGEDTFNDRPKQGEDRGPPRRGRQDGPAPRRREGYRPEMENQADFLAYVRDQEKGRGGGGGGGGRGGNR